MKNLFKIIILSIFFIFASNIFAGEINIYEKKELRTMTSLKWAPDEIVVKFKDGVKKDKIDKFNNKQNTKIIYKSKYNKFLRLKVPKGKSIDSIIKTYSLNEDVLYAEPNYMATAFYTPTDTFFSPYQWNLMDENYKDSEMEAPSLWGINMNSAWNITSGSSNIIVAVVDSGVAYKNKGRRYKQAPDLENTSFVVDESRISDFINFDGEPLDDEGHGTHVTGTIAQSTNNNGIGTAGIAFSTSIMPVKVLNSNGSGSYTAIADGIRFAVDNGAKIINLSLGGPSNSQTLYSAIHYANSNGVLLVCAAGNDYEEGNPLSYPAVYEECITVAATRYDGTRSYYSNTGDYVDIAAPGGDVTVDQNNDGYGDGILQQTFGKRPNDFGYYFYQGTSMAAPHVSGVIALLLANDPFLTPSLIKETIYNTARDVGEDGKDNWYGWGLIDAYAALNYDSSTLLVPDIVVNSITLDAPVIKDDIVEVVVRVSNISTKDESLIISLKDKTDNYDIGDEFESVPKNGSLNVSFNWNTSLASTIGIHELEAIVSTVDDEENLDNNSLSVFPTIIDTLELSVDSISMNSRKQGKRYSAIADIIINQPSVKVDASWYVDEVYQSSGIGTSDINGFIRFSSNKEVLNQTKSFKIVIDKLNDIVLNPKPEDSISIPE